MHFLLIHYDISEETPKDVAVSTTPGDAIHWLVQKAIPNIKDCPEGYNESDVLELVNDARESKPVQFAERWNKMCEVEKLLCFEKSSPFLGPADSEPLIKELEELAGECV